MLLHDILPEHCQVVGVALQQVAAVTPLCHLVMSAVTIVKIREKILTLSGDTDIVLAAGDVLHKHFNVAREEAGVMEGALLAKPTAEEEGEIENSGQVVSDNDGYVAAEETETEAALPALASSEATGEVAETVTDAMDMSGPALATAEEEENSGLARALGNNDGYVAAEEMETGTEAALPALEDTLCSDVMKTRGRGW